MPRLTPRLGMAVGACAGLLCLATTGCSVQVDQPQPPPPPAEVTIEEFEAWRTATPWRSHEELLQFFVDHDAAYRSRGAIVRLPVLQRMAAEMQSMFPIGSCTELLYADGLLHISLTEDLKVHVPGAYHQAFLVLPKELLFKVVPPAAEGKPWIFHVEVAKVRLEFSWLAKTFGPSFLHDIDVEQLEYSIDRQGHHALMAVDERITRGADGTLAVNGHAPADPPGLQRYLAEALTHARTYLDPGVVAYLDQHQQPPPALLLNGHYAFDLELRHLHRIDVRLQFPDYRPAPTPTPTPTAPATATPAPAATSGAGSPAAPTRGPGLVPGPPAPTP
jgi:hypothetical protein